MLLCAGGSPLAFPCMPLPACPIVPCCSKFEADGMLNPTFETGAFELPVQRMSGAWPE